MSAAPHLHVVNTETGEIQEGGCPTCQANAEMVIGQEATIKQQAAAIGRLKRQLEDDDLEAHPQRTEISNLIDRWRRATGHTRAKASKDRFDVIRARLKDGYTFEHLELAIDGIAAFPFVVNAQRSRTGKPSQRHDKLSLCLRGGEHTEGFANLGSEARKQGLVTW